MDSLIHALHKLSLKGAFTSQEFGDALEMVKGDLDDKTIEDYLTLARRWGLISKGPRMELNRLHAHAVSQYTTRKGDEKEKARAYLFNLLKFRDEVVRHFFICLSTGCRTFDELKRGFRNNPQTPRTILGWAKWAGKVEKDKTRQCFYSVTEDLRITRKRFWAVLSAVYRQLSRTEFVGVRSPFVSIPEMKERTCADTGLSSAAFDEQLEMLLNDPRYWPRMELTAAPAAFLEEEARLPWKKPFRYSQKAYYFIALK